MASQVDPQSYYRSRGKRVSLTADPNLIAVRYARDGRFGPSLLGKNATRLLRDATPVAFVPNHGVQILRVPNDHVATDLPLDRDAHVDFAAPLQRIEGRDDQVVIVLPRVIARFRDDLQRVDIEALLDAYDASILEARPALGNTYILRAGKGFGHEGPVALANRLVDDGHAIKASPDIVRRVEFRGIGAAKRQPKIRREPERREARAAPPEFAGEQWHLDTARVRGAWSTTRGAGVTLAVLDDGIAVDHAEFVGRVQGEHDFANGGTSAQPVSSTDNHGTACAGVALAAGVKASGAAPEAKLLAARTPVWLGTSEEIDMFQWCASQGAAVVSCSWGPAQPHALPDMIDEVLDYLANEARNGKGTLILFAAGNESEDMTTDGYAASPHVMAIAASTDQDEQAWYSDFGSEIDLCAPSNGGAKGIFTTDRPGAEGYNSGSAANGDTDGDYTNDFGGTSSATPLVAGIAALVASANPALRAAEVRDILQSTADKIGDPSDYTGGHSPKYGYGRVNAAAAVTEAVRRIGSSSTAGSGSGSNGSLQAQVTIEGPALAGRNGSPPQFTVRTTLPFWTVEVARDPKHFDASRQGRTEATFYSSFDAEGVMTGDSYRLPDRVWDLLRDGEILAYRAIAASSAQGDGAVYSTPDSDAANAQRIRIEESGPTAGAAASSVRFPSGATFRIVSDPQDGEDYADPVAGGLTPLIDTQGRLEEQLSENFVTSEFAASRYRYARISTELVRGLQAMRSETGSPLTILSAYRPPAKNAAVDGAPRSQHLAGRAADIRIRDLTPLQVAALAIKNLGSDIGLGLGPTSIHVDLRGALTTWVYSGASLSESEFDDWARREARQRSGLRGERHESTHRDGPTIEGSLDWTTEEEVPSFLVYPGRNAFVALEFAADPKLFWPSSTGSPRTPKTFAATWERGLMRIGQGQTLTIQPHESLWSRLAGSERIYYRAVTSATNSGAWVDTETSLRLDEMDVCPYVAIVRGGRDTSWLGDRAFRRKAEHRWRG